MDTERDESIDAVFADDDAERAVDDSAVDAE
jgi:hypothetical protein